MKRNYINMCTKEYITLGRNDAVNDYKDRSEEIIRDLINVLDKSSIMNILISYFKGYKIGNMEKHIRYIIPGAYYSEDMAAIVINYNGERHEVFSKEYVSQSNLECIEKAQKLIMRKNND